MFGGQEKSWLDEELERERKSHREGVSLWSRIMDILGRIRRKPVYEATALTSPILQTAVYDRAFADLETAAREYLSTASESAKEAYVHRIDQELAAFQGTRCDIFFTAHRP